MSRLKYIFLTFKKHVGKYAAVNSSSNDASWQFITLAISHI